MKRKAFLSALVPASLSIKAISGSLAAVPNSNALSGISIPPYLQKGDTIGICSPAGYITRADIQPAIDRITQWGYRVAIGDSIGRRAYTFGGTDDERLADLQQMMDAPYIKAILCARGGYGSVRIVDRLQFQKFVQQPKWIIGFSDITVLHSHIQHNYGIASIHSKMCNSFPTDWSKAEPIQIETIQSIADCLSGKAMRYTAAPNAFNKTGEARGALIGGNLKTLESLSGSASDINTDGKLLFVEDTGESLYSIDRMFWNLKRSGKLNKLAGLLVGGFKIKPDDPGDEFGYSLGQIVSDKVKEYHYPVCFDFPVGHQKNNYALKCGAEHRLQVNTQQTILTDAL